MAWIKEGKMSGFVEIITCSRTSIVQLDFDEMVYVQIDFVPLVHVQLSVDQVAFLVR